MLQATYELGDALLTTLAIFFFVIWIWVVISIIMDIFRDHEMGGGVKALWILALFIIPPFAALIYLIFRGSGMRGRAIKEQADAKKHFDDYVRETAATSPVDELHKLDQLKQSGGVTEDEYNKMKAKIIG